MRIVNMLRELRDSAEPIQSIFTEGSCFRLYRILVNIFPQARPFYSQVDGHWITEIDGKYYDIGGEIDPSFVLEKQYEHITNEGTLASAYICKWSENPKYSYGTSYNKYIQTT